jgi:predicted Fe-Mo cluster-binding NifX family protein
MEMKIAISASNDDLNGEVVPVFGRCAGFIIAEAEGSEIKSHQFIDNPGKNAMGGAGIAAARTVVEQAVEAVITGNLGPNAGLILEQSNIKAYQATGMKIKAAVQALAKGGLEQVKGSNVAPDFGRGPGTGAGRGTGRGRDMGGGKGTGPGRGFGRME